MASQLPEQKLLKAITDNCADLRLNEVAVGHGIGNQPYEIQSRWFNIILSYIYSMSHNYEMGLFPNNTYEIARLSKKIKDLAFSDEYTTSIYSHYGDYEMANGLINDAVNLTLFDIA
jgi:hypothetical protein